MKDAKTYKKFLEEAKKSIPPRPHWEIAWAERYIDEFDWSYVEEKLMKPLKKGGSGFSRATVVRTKPQWKKYLLQAFIWPDDAMRPGPEIDEWWHSSMLDSEPYTTFCNRLFGKYMHHSPDKGKD